MRLINLMEPLKWNPENVWKTKNLEGGGGGWINKMK